MDTKALGDTFTFPDRRSRTWLWGRRLLPTLIAIVVAWVVGVATWGITRSTRPPQLVGALLTPPARAYNLRLRDEAGRIVSLENFRGKVVALTFLYTHCPDVCPLIADKMHKAYQSLGNSAKQVAFIAVSVDHEEIPLMRCGHFLRPTTWRMN